MEEAINKVMEAIPPKPEPVLLAGLGAILVLVLVLPFVSRKVEENLEPFFLGMGLLGIGLLVGAGVVRDHDVLIAIFRKALESPVIIGGKPFGIVQAVLIFGLLFYYMHDRIVSGVRRAVMKMGLPLFTFVIVSFVGLISSLISVIVTAVILAEIVVALPLTRRDKITFTVLASFALGMGAVLTPVGEPLSTIAVSKLRPPNPFTYLFHLMGPIIIPGVIGVAAFTAYMMRRASIVEGGEPGEEALVEAESLRTVIIRAVKVYMFVAALELLGVSLLPLTVWYFSKMPSELLYWVNTISAVVDNATLTAAEISPLMTTEQIRSALTSLLISGGMLIPGNIPNIVAAGRLRITMKEWARLGVPFGVALLLIYFVYLHVI